MFEDVVVGVPDAVVEGDVPGVGVDTVLFAGTTTPPVTPAGALVPFAAAAAALYASNVWEPAPLTTPTMPEIQWFLGDVCAAGG